MPSGDGLQVGLALLHRLGLELRQTEVEDLDAAVPGEEQVLGLQVPMDDPLLVGRGEALGDLHRVVDRLADRDRARAEAAPERLALEQLRDDVRRAFVAADVVDRGDVRMVETARGRGLLLEAVETIRVLGERRGQDLDRDLALEPRILRAVDLAHPPGADRREDFVGA